MLMLAKISGELVCVRHPSQVTTPHNSQLTTNRKENVFVFQYVIHFTDLPRRLVARVLEALTAFIPAIL